VAAVETPASNVYSAYLQVGRKLKNPLLAVAVLLRHLGMALLTLGVGGFDADSLAPTWVVLVHTADRKVVKKLAAGRDAGAGEGKLVAVLADLDVLAVGEFRRRYGLDEDAHEGP
jgi:hypothetical protein